MSKRIFCSAPKNSAPATPQAMLIHITGASGSGTSTLAAALAQELAFVHVEADDHYWLPTDPPFSSKRDPGERASMLVSKLRAQPNTVLAGSVVGWGAEIEDAFDLIVFLYLDAGVRVERLRRRENERFGCADPKFLEWAAQYDAGPPEGRSLAKHRAWLNARRCPVLELSGDLTVKDRLACVLRHVNELQHMNPTPVTLREITAETVLPIVRLSVAESQKGFVASNAVSLAQALFAPEAWYRAVYFGEEPAGFVMLEDESLRSPCPAQPKVGVWRLMIDQRFQGRGIGRAALQQVIDHVRAKGLFASLELSYVPGPGCPEPFYLALGFRHTGRLDGVEVVLELPLSDNAG